VQIIYITHIVRRVLKTVLDPSLLDDKDYYGNKRLELAGSLISLLFEDLFKRFNTDLKKQVDMILSKPNRASSFDVMKFMRTDTISQVPPCLSPLPSPYFSLSVCLPVRDSTMQSPPGTGFSNVSKWIVLV
jgi:hypothetical protein